MRAWVAAPARERSVSPTPGEAWCPRSEGGLARAARGAGELHANAALGNLAVETCGEWQDVLSDDGLFAP